MPAFYSMFGVPRFVLRYITRALLEGTPPSDIRFNEDL